MTAIRVELELADGNFVTRVLRAGQTLQSLSADVSRLNPNLKGLHNAGLSVVNTMTRVDQVSKGFLATLRDVSIVAGLASVGISKLTGIQNTFVGSIVRVNAEFERLTFQMRGMARSSEPIREAGENVAWLRQKATEMPFALKSITDGFVRLTATGINPTGGALNALADGITAFGGGEEQMKRTLVGISQMSGKGVIQMEEMRQQLAEHMPRAMELMARSMGVSMSQLIREIGTGRLASKPALEAFFEELDRTFGGTAQQMMQTFNGQLQRTKTQLELLATSDSIKLNFFDGALKDQLRDLNDFLTSPRAQAYADQLGNAMAKSVVWIRQVIDTLVQFRTEIGNVAMAAATVFGANLLFKGLGTVRAAFGTLRTELAAAGVQMALASQKAAYWTIAANSGAPATIRFGAALSTLSARFTGLMMAGAAFAPWIAGIGLAVYAAGEYFGWFRDRVSEAIDELQRFGTESRAVADEATAAKTEQLENDIARWERQANSDRLQYGGIVAPETIENLQKARDALADFAGTAKSMRAEAGEREDAKMLERFQDTIAKRNRMLQGGYDREMVAINDHYNKLVETTRKSGGDVQKVEEDRNKALGDRAKQLYADRLQIVEDYLTVEQELIGKSTGVARIQSQQRLDYLFGQKRQAQEALANFNPRSIELLGKLDDPQANIDKGNKHLDSLKQSIAGVRAEIGGASPELAKLQEMLARGEYGDMGREEVRKLAEEIGVATASLEKLKELQDGQKDAENELKRIEDKLFDQKLDLMERQTGKTLTEGERFIMRMDNGAFTGLGPASKIAKALEGVSGRLDIAGSKMNQLGNVARDNAFGEQTNVKIRGVNDELRETAAILDSIGRSLSGLNFNGFTMPGQTFLPGSSTAGFNGSMLDLIAKVESGGDYNATLDHGKWTGGPQNLVSMTLNQVRDLQRQMLANPANRAKYGQGKGSSALGRYQIVGQTLEGLIKEMGLSGNELYDQNMQDAMATRLMSRRGNSIAGLRAEWEGLKHVPDATIRQALSGGQTYGPQQPASAAVPTYDSDKEANLQNRLDASEKLRDAAKKLTTEENDLISATQKQNRIDLLKDITEQAEEAAKGVEGTGKNVEALKKKIKTGDLGSKELDASEYKELLAAAEQLDKVEKARDDRKKAMDKVKDDQSEFGRRQIELARRVEEANARMLDPLEQKSSSTFRSLRRDLEAHIAQVETAYGKDTDQYRAALALKETMLREHRNMEVSEKAAGWAQDTINVRRGLMSEKQQRELALQDEIARIDAEVAAFQGTEEEKVRIVAAAEERKAALRAQAAAVGNPMSGMMKEWGDLQGNLEKGAANWMNSLADGLTGLITGTGDLRSMVNGMIKDIVNMGVKYLMSQIMQGKSQAAGAAGGKLGGKGGKGGGKAGGGGMKALFGQFHTGGIVGAASVHRAINPGIFAGAQRYHTGGIVSGPKLSRGEVPIIAQEGEGVFTPEQMSALGGFQQANNFQINAPVTVAGSAGTPEQNTDMANKMAKQMEVTMRTVVADEIRRQTRPGNFLNNRNR